MPIISKSLCYILTIFSHHYILMRHAALQQSAVIETTFSQMAVVITLGAKLKQKKKNVIDRLVTHGVNTKIVRTAPAGESLNEFFARSCINFLVSSVNVVTNTSHDTYGTGWRAYINWCCMANIDHTLVTPPAAYSQVVAIYDHNVTSIGAFISFLAFELKLSPHTVVNYVCRVRDGSDENTEISPSSRTQCSSRSDQLLLSTGGRSRNAPLVLREDCRSPSKCSPRVANISRI